MKPPWATPNDPYIKRMAMEIDEYLMWESIYCTCEAQCACGWDEDTPLDMEADL